MSHSDVIISGLGPTGATLAGLLGQRGHKVTVFDRLPDLYPLPRAIGLDHEVMRVMQELGVAQRLDNLVAPYAATEFLGMDGQVIKRIIPAPPPWPLGWHPSYSFNQPGFERAIRSRLAELPNVKIHLEAEVLRVGESAGASWVEAQLKGSMQPERFSADWVVACDGGRSAIRGQLGIPLEDLDFDEPWLVVDAIVSDSKLGELPRTHTQYCQAERPSTYVIGPGNHRRWEIMLLPGDSLSPDFPEVELWPLLSRWIKPGDAQLWRAATYRFHGLVAERWRQGRTLLAGDAAHMTPPFMAQGMAQGIRDAHNLSWKLDRVLRRQSDDALLDTYQAERRPHVVTTTRTAIDMGRVICERDPSRARERDKQLLREQGGVVKEMVRQNMIPTLTRGAIAVGQPGAGQIFPQPEVRLGDKSALLDTFIGPRVSVIILDTLNPEERLTVLSCLAPLQGILVDLDDTGHAASDSLSLAESAAISRWLEERSASFAIVRPDHYVYSTGLGFNALLAGLKGMTQGLAATPRASVFDDVKELDATA